MKFVLPSLLLLCVLFTSNSYAQKNIIKWRPAALLWNNIDFSYERVLNDKSSFAVKAGGMVPLDLTSAFNSNKASFQQSGYSLGGYTMTKGIMGGFSILPEYRYYTAAEAPNGFYVAPYLKFWRAGISATATNDTTTSASTLNTSINIIGVGVGIGYQWVIGDAFTVDWNFVGLGVDAYIFNVNITGVDANGTADQIREQFPGTTVTTSGNSVDLTSSPLFNLGFKSNFSIGYMF
jgi:hypothetical protein